MVVNELSVASEEQTLALLNGYKANIFFDPYYKRWYYNLYNGDVLVYAGFVLDPDTASLLGFSDYFLACVDKLDSKEMYEPYNELGSRLGLLEVSQ